MGNLRSVSKAVEKLGGSVCVSSEPRDLETADKIILPGVGAFGNACAELRKRKLFEPLHEAIQAGKPFLGICLGMQLLFESSEESPGVPGLGIFKGTVQRFRNSQLKIPHMGWNQMKVEPSKSPFLSEVKEGSFFYFVHSFYPVPRDPSVVLGSCDYGGERFAAFVSRGAIGASQFHPEKSQESGLQILRNFISF